MHVRAATAGDAPVIAEIYNQGIEERIATFETARRSITDVARWFDGRHPLVVVEENGAVLGFAATFEYRSRACYAGIAEFSVYVDRAARGRGVGRLAMAELARLSEANGFWKLVSRILIENQPSRRLMRSLGFREVGTYVRHAKVDGTWRDVVIVELLLGEAADAVLAETQEAVEPVAAKLGALSEPTRE